MKETTQKIEFYNEFVEKVEKQAITEGSKQTSFLKEMLTYMEQSDDPEIFYIPYKKSSKKIHLNAYLYDTDQNSLNLYVVDYQDQEIKDDIESTNMSSLLEVANRAKRFFTNAKFLLEDVLDESSREVSDLAKTIIESKNDLEEVNIFVLTNKFYLSNKAIELSIPGVETTNVQVWDMDRIYQLSLAEQGIQDFYIDLEDRYNQSFEMMFVPNDSSVDSHYNFDCYIGFIPATLLAQLYEDWGPKLVERNVRSFLQARGGTNKGIRDTLKDSNQRQMFVAYNNGISSVARLGNIEKVDGVNLYRVKGLTGWQIVNGGQTTASIHQAYKNDIDLTDVYIQAKLTILKVEAHQEKDQHIIEDEMVSKISEYANTQNKINKSDLLANTRFMSDIEKFSRSTWIPTQDGRREEEKWYFERARGQYMVDIGRRKRGKEQNDFKKQYPKEKVLTKVELAKYFMSWEGYPHISSKGGEEAFKKFMNHNSQYWKHEKDQPTSIQEMDNDFYKALIARSIINHHITNIVEQMKLKGYKANVIYYTTAMFSHIYGENINLIDVWKKQSVPAKWANIIRTIASYALNYLKESAGDRNVTQWAKQEACWTQFKQESTKQLSNIL
ncbi:AIPR family protein [Priestia megaterium]|uniref:AIPR family protein n=1 Tax=Priestia megaterium TaxID=1404 RepID=UPI001CD52A0B|nr:AIPR family protein [Priestia megaterium]